MQFRQLCVAGVMLGLSLVATPVARADATAGDVKLMQQALDNLNIARFWLVAGNKAIAGMPLDAAGKAKVLKNYARILANSKAGMVAALAQEEAGHFSAAEVGEIAKLAAVPAYRQLVILAYEGKKAPPLKTAPQAEQQVISDIGVKPHAGKFLDEITHDKASGAKVVELMQKAVNAP